MARKKYFTAKDVDLLIPKLESIFEHITMCETKAQGLSAAPSGKTPSAPDSRAQSEISFWLEAIEDDLNYIYRLGGITKDVEGGLVGF